MYGGGRDIRRQEKVLKGVFMLAAAMLKGLQDAFRHRALTVTNWPSEQIQGRKDLPSGPTLLVHNHSPTRTYYEKDPQG